MQLVLKYVNYANYLQSSVTTTKKEVATLHYLLQARITFFSYAVSFSLKAPVFTGASLLLIFLG